MNFNFFDTIGQSLFGGGSSSGEYPGLFGNPTEAWDQFKNGQTNVVNKEIAEQNLQFQRENLDYQKALQERIFDREDTSYQRTVNDMRQAGLNPLTMNGTNGSGEAIATTPLHNDFQMQDQGIGTVIGDLLATMNGIQNFQIGTSYAKEQEAKAKSAQAQAEIDNATYLDKINDLKVDSKTKEKLYDDFLRNMKFNQDLNIFNGMDQNSRDTRIMQALYGNDKETQDFAQKYGLNQMEVAGIKVGKIFNPLLEGAEKNAENTKKWLENDPTMKLTEKIKENYKKHGLKFWKWGK